VIHSRQSGDQWEPNKGVERPSAVLHELKLKTRPGVCSMAPGLGGFNIAPPRSNEPGLEGELSGAPQSGRKGFPPLSSGKERKTARLLVGILSIAFNALTVIAVLGPVLLDAADRQVIEVRAVGALGNDRRPKAFASLIIANQKGFADEPLPLGISVRDGTGKETVTLSGIPTNFDLSSGSSLGAGEWLVSSSDLDAIYVGSSESSARAMETIVRLHSPNGQLLDTRVIRFEWVDRSAGASKPAIEVPNAPPVEQPLIPPQGYPQYPREQLAVNPPQGPAVVPPLRAANLLGLGENLRKRGDIAAARPALERAAVAGNAQAALELAMTFDRAFLSQWGAVGTVPDEAKARDWYNKAIQLGSTEALQRRDRLADKPK
jgi:hypothetical protein